ncbi:hypothetical protein ACFFGV_14430 [Pontibacillus salicampi]|uniref:Uncharacterized protein n=1 Tax=Pontibacillus salicampi TaxID=1449801 RepID=A0ABV6LQS9_9BACI
MDMLFVGSGIIILTAFLASIVQGIMTFITGGKQRTYYKDFSRKMQFTWRKVGKASTKKYW